MGTLTKKAQAQQARAEAICELQKLCPPGTKLWTVMRSINRGRTVRRFDVLLRTDETHHLLNAFIERLNLGWKRDRDGHLVTNTCGNDVGFEVVYRVSSLIHGDGYALKHDWI